MAAQLVRKRHNDSEIRNPPSARCIRSEVNHTSTQRQDNDVHAPEISKDTIETDLETGLLELLGRRGPLDLNAEEMAAERFAQMVGEATEEEQEEGHPLDAVA